jgi:HPt (histidine-containing phosphotransfer) domain-containing protein
VENYPTVDARILDLRVLGEVCAVPGRFEDPVLVRLIALFLAEETARVARLAELAAARDRVELARAAHKLAGSGAVIGATALMEAAQRLELESGKAPWETVEARLVAVNDAWGALLPALGAMGLVRK